MMRYDGHFRLAHELGKHLHEVMGWNGPMTHRQFVVWQMWLNEQLNIPTRDNYYQMQIACEQRRTFSKNPASIKMEGFKLTFTQREGSKTAVTKEQKLQMIKNRWIGRMTAPITVIQDGIEQKEKVLPPLLRQKEELKRLDDIKRANANKRIQAQQKLKQQSKQQNKKPSQSNSSQGVTNGDSTGVGRTDGKNVGGRKQIRGNARRGKKEDGG